MHHCISGDGEIMSVTVTADSASLCLCNFKKLGKTEQNCWASPFFNV